MTESNKANPMLIDISDDLRNTDGLNKAVIFASELQRRSLEAEHFGRLHYFLGNAWSNLHNLANQTAAWEDAAFERAILADGGPKMEDSPVNQKVLLVMLCRLGYLASAVSQGVQALRDLDAHACDVIIMDVQVPDMDGREDDTWKKDARTWIDREIELTSVTLQPDARMLA